ncbi:NAD(P)-binding domain-containing protein [Leptospira ellisii]|uniref:NAD(P)-binding domain-containing protein n=2 Tax=Leptospira ellisii TaxID=2023197 RepID=A0AAE4QPS8_9LEPT|nr:NAD(P)-binding domain-containing protein [Leptospira ellisii]MDV6236725.1 NAD(P)-binding domain-containing protein [Leptospira ellisii]PKA05406.1 pyridine nucleotide-disulfide oxidoreductase [Leptospira ellisii]
MNFSLPILSRYFRWLHNDAPQGGTEFYPEISETFETSVPGIRIAGDLTGIPLLKFAAESGLKTAEEIIRKNGSRIRKSATDPSFYDVIVVGAGPAGVSAGMELSRVNYKFRILESNVPFYTIKSYPKGKPIFAEPAEPRARSGIEIKNGTKESLLEDLEAALRATSLPISVGTRVIEIRKIRSGFSLLCENGEEFLTEEVILAVGKSGDAKSLNVPGESLSKVYHRWIDPKDFANENVLVVGGGDSAVEAAISVSEHAAKTTLSFRGKELARPKEENRFRLQTLVRSGKVEFLPETEVERIEDETVSLIALNRETQKRYGRSIPNTSVLVQIGSVPPLEFLKRIGIRINNRRGFWDWLGFAVMILFANGLYFGKASFYGNQIYAAIASVSFSGFGALSIPYGIRLFRKRSEFFADSWKIFKNVYITSAAAYFLFVYAGARYADFFLFGKQPGFHYTLLYSITILIFGLRRMKVKPTSYIRRQTWTLILIQIFPLFLLPEIILPFLGERGWLGSQDGFLLTQVFPYGAYWNAYGLILAWPLNLGIFYNPGITSFWLVYGILQTFAVIPFLVYRYGKGAYCGWICSCGGLAETLGDEHRTKMPHGKFADRLENSGQWILLFAAVITLFKLVEIFLSPWLPWAHAFGPIGDQGKKIYDVIVDLLLAGVVGVGAYFFLSGRVWCRFFCPLAALMHVYARFGRFRIVSEKKRCISCNICTRVCHQGIDVMNYANRGIPMDNVQCVRCSACIVNCPTDVLSFGTSK